MMKRIDATLDGITRTFRINNSGNYLFIDRDGANSQINCKHYSMLSQAKKDISDYMRGYETVGRIKYTNISGWETK